MTSRRDERPAGRPSRRGLLRAGLAGIGGLGLVGATSGRVRAQPPRGTICVVWEIGGLEIYEVEVWAYYGQECQEPFGTFVYYSPNRLNPDLFGCGGIYCFPAAIYSHTQASAYALAMGAPATSATRHARFQDKDLRRKGLARPLPANRQFRVGALGRVRVLEEGNYRVAGLKHPVHLVLALATPPDDQSDHRTPPLLVGFGVTTHAPQVPLVQVPLNVLRPRVDEQYALIYRPSDDVFFQVFTCGE